MTGIAAVAILGALLTVVAAAGSVGYYVMRSKGNGEPSRVEAKPDVKADAKSDAPLKTPENDERALVGLNKLVAVARRCGSHFARRLTGVSENFANTSKQSRTLSSENKQLRRVTLGSIHCIIQCLREFNRQATIVTCRCKNSRAPDSLPLACGSSINSGCKMRRAGWG